MRIVPIRALVALAYMAGVLALTTVPLRQFTRLGLKGPLLDLMHIPLFTGLALVTLWAVVGPRAQRLGWVVTSLVLFAAADEGLQHWVPGRVASFADFARDVLGIAIGVVIAEGLRPLAVAWRGETQR
jgi:hypothetical protein